LRICALHRNVEGASRLVADHDPRLEHGARVRSRRAALPARELRWHAPAHLGGEADTFENFGNAAIDLAARQRPLRLQRQRHDIPDVAARIERGERILKHRLDQPVRAPCGRDRTGGLPSDQHGSGGRREKPRIRRGER